MDHTMSSYLTAFESGMLNKPRIAYGPAEHDRTPEQDAALTAEREEETRQRYIAADQAAAYRTYAPNILFSGVRAGEQISTP